MTGLAERDIVFFLTVHVKRTELSGYTPRQRFKLAAFSTAHPMPHAHLERLQAQLKASPLATVRKRGGYANS